MADVSPASITHDVKGTASTGNPDADAEAAFGPVCDGKICSPPVRSG
ncbi:peptidase U35, phage prohead HK97 [Escherichia coli DEC10A]|nr:peptidase U35, phage prohead HK97 [Escherichia coli DEC10A]